MISYFKIIEQIKIHGKMKENRTGVRALTKAGALFEHDMQQGFPLLTSKYVHLPLVASELEFFIKGLTDKSWLQERNNHIWDEFSFVDGFSLDRDKERREIYQLKSKDLGCIYGYQWRQFNADRIPPAQANIPFEPLISYNPELLRKSENYGDFYILHKHGNKTTVQFKDTGYLSSFDSQQVNSGRIKDPYFLKYWSVACIGLPDTNLAYYSKAKLIWTNLIARCYNPENKDYSLYGGKGVRICNDWLVFEYFLRDLPKLPNWDLKLKYWDGFTLDKDIIGNGFIYSVSNCKWSSKSEQALNRSGSIRFDAISPDNEYYHNVSNLSDFCKQINIDSGDANRMLNNKRDSPIKGWKFLNKKSIIKNRYKGIDQFQIIVDRLKTDPDDRRMIVSAWNPKQLNQMALPPCHWGFQVTVIDGYLNLLWNQRSVDIALGLPFNIASYGLLLELLALESGLKPGMLIGFLADVHIYENHLEGIDIQLSRPYHGLPTIEIVNFTSIFDWEYTNLQLHDYKHSGKLNFKIAI